MSDVQVTVTTGLSLGAGDLRYVKVGDPHVGGILLAEQADTARHIVRTTGDSLTAGTLGDPYQFTLETLLGPKTWLVRNGGRAGDTTAMMLTRFTADILGYHDAEYVVILGGINDVCNAGAGAATVTGILQDMYTAAHAAGLSVVAVTILPFGGSSVWSAPRQAVVDAVNAWILATATNVEYRVNAYAALEDPSVPDALLPAYADPGKLHMTAAGYAALGTAIHAGVTWTPRTGANLLLGKTNVVLDQSLQATSIPCFAGLGIGTLGTPHGTLEVVGNIMLEDTHTPTNGIIYRGGLRWLHNYSETGSEGQNVFLGINAGNVLMGPAGGSANLGSHNIGIGDNALFENRTGTQLVAIGPGALYHNVSGQNNIGIGNNALRANVSGNGLTGIGTNALLANTSGANNTAVGIAALSANTTGADLVAIGANALLTNTTGSGSVAIGKEALLANTVGNGSTAVGYSALTANTTGNYNTAIGRAALRANITGSGNVALGYAAGIWETGSNKFFIDNAARTDEADGRVKALIYGAFSATVAGQSLTFNAGYMGFFGHVAAAQPLKASHGNWAALSDVVAALVEIGILNTA